MCEPVLLAVSALCTDVGHANSISLYSLAYHHNETVMTVSPCAHHDTIITSGSPIRLTITVPEVVRTHLGGVAGFCFLCAHSGDLFQEFRVVTK